MNDGKKVKYSYESGEHLFFTSDTHFSHANIMKFCGRPFKNVGEMNNTIIKNWNNVVGPEDTVFHLGDFAFGGLNVWEPIREQLNGHIVLILGNHDFKQNIQNQERLDKMFELVTQQMYIEVEGQKVYLNHYPFLCYGGTYNKQKPTWQLFGHLHLKKGSTGLDTSRVECCFPYQYDVGVDLNGFTPLSWKQVNEKILFQIEHNTNVAYWLK